MKTNKIYGYVISSDGTEFKIVERKTNLERRVNKLKSKLEDNNIELEPVLCLYGGGEYLDVEDILSISFKFDEEHPETGSINFLKMLKFSYNISAVISHSTFNSIMLKYIMNDENKLLTPALATEIVRSQNVFLIDSFIDKFSIPDKVILFTENPYRTESNMQKYKENIIDTIKFILKNNIEGNTIFEYKEYDLLDGDSELRVAIDRLNSDYFENSLNLYEIYDELIETLEESLLSNMDNQTAWETAKQALISARLTENQVFDEISQNIDNCKIKNIQIENQINILREKRQG